jgi:HD superfamily phosphohydrolase
VKQNSSFNKGNIFNDPIYGFITIPHEIIFKLIEHPYFQRLRRINQLGLTHLVYAGAHHTRFHHAIGATHLMTKAVKTLQTKGFEITEEEELGVLIAILLHDIGHGPFSHALEHSIVDGVHHEELSSLFMLKLNDEFNGQLTLAIEIFNNKYHKKFLHQLVSSQLDMDRLDYLKRDSFFSGVVEGAVSSERIIKMLTVVNDQLAVEAKGIYSIENFLIARRLMYWQVYLHKAVLSAEFMLMKILKRAKELAKNNIDLFTTPTFKKFIYNTHSIKDFAAGDLLQQFALLDDYDILTSIKVWMDHDDYILSTLSKNLINRNLYKIVVSSDKPSQKKVDSLSRAIMSQHSIKKEDLEYFIFTNTIKNSAYNPQEDKINIVHKGGEIQDITEAADLLNISALSKSVEKNFICYIR